MPKEAYMQTDNIQSTIKKRLKGIPAGMILLPLLLGSLLNTIAPEALKIGSYTTALFSGEGAATLMALQIFCIGAQIRMNIIVSVIRRGGVLLLAKLLAGLLVALLFRFFAQDGLIAGISVLAAVAAISNTNGSIFIATTSLLDRKESAACAPLLALSNGPFLTLLILGLSGVTVFSWLPLLALVLPMVLGIIIGNASHRAADFLAPGVALTLPFIGFALGAGIDLRQLWLGGVSGALLAVAVLVIGGGIALLLDVLLNRDDGVAGISASATGANAIAVPAAIALANPVWQAQAGAAAAQISASVLIGALMVPLLAQWLAARKNGQRSELNPSLRHK